MNALLVGGYSNGRVINLSHLEQEIKVPKPISASDLKAEDLVLSSLSVKLYDKYTPMFVSGDQQYAVYSCLSRDHTFDVLVGSIGIHG